jgi:hypothetical protein
MEGWRDGGMERRSAAWEVLRAPDALRAWDPFSRAERRLWNGLSGEGRGVPSGDSGEPFGKKRRVPNGRDWANEREMWAGGLVQAPGGIGGDGLAWFGMV